MSGNTAASPYPEPRDNSLSPCGPEGRAVPTFQGTSLDILCGTNPFRRERVCLVWKGGGDRSSGGAHSLPGQGGAGARTTRTISQWQPSLGPPELLLCCYTAYWSSVRHQHHVTGKMKQDEAKNSLYVC